MDSTPFRDLLLHPAVQALVAAAGKVETHLVGGVLRDNALGLPLKDIDAVVASRGKEIAERLAETLPARLVLLGGKEFAAYRLVAQDLDVDLWDRAGTTLHEDLARRDFTVNSFALEPHTGTLTDPFDGLGDLARRLLRATTAESFSGDPLRVLRLPRLLLRLPGFSADPATVELARQSVPHLTRVAAERVRDELTFLLEPEDAGRGVALLVALGVYPGLWLDQPGAPLPAGCVLAEGEALRGRLHDLQQVDAEAAAAADGRIARHAILLRNLPLSPTHGTLRDVLARVRDAGYLTRQTTEDVALVLALDDLPVDEVDLRRFLHRAKHQWSTAICALGARWTAGEGLTRWQAVLPRLADLARREGEALFDPPRLITGADVQDLLGIPPGREVGRLLDAVRSAQVDGHVRTREEAEAVVRYRSTG
ncbi:MAG TPA: hypothetical protein DD490_23395 [Acidobacteria bacterium]|nr:hypothetical protein [Acidobacteriota bacterium]